MRICSSTLNQESHGDPSHMPRRSIWCRSLARGARAGMYPMLSSSALSRSTRSAMSSSLPAGVSSSCALRLGLGQVAHDACQHSRVQTRHLHHSHHARAAEGRPISPRSLTRPRHLAQLHLALRLQHHQVTQQAFLVHPRHLPCVRFPVLHLLKQRPQHRHRSRVLGLQQLDDARPAVHGVKVESVLAGLLGLVQFRVRILRSRRRGCGREEPPEERAPAQLPPPFKAVVCGEHLCDGRDMLVPQLQRAPQRRDRLAVTLQDGRANLCQGGGGRGRICARVGGLESSCRAFPRQPTGASALPTQLTPPRPFLPFPPPAPRLACSAGVTSSICASPSSATSVRDSSCRQCTRPFPHSTSTGRATLASDSAPRSQAGCRRARPQVAPALRTCASEGRTGGRAAADPAAGATAGRRRCG
eukprot:scaffold5375_cov110-Isochrysis_galbana.AAC.2